MAEKIVLGLKPAAESESEKVILGVKSSPATSALQSGSTQERAAIKAKVKAELLKIEKDHVAGSVLPDVREVLGSLLEWISGREARTDARPGGL